MPIRFEDEEQTTTGKIRFEDEPKKRTTWEELGRQVGLTARAGATGVSAIPAMFGDFFAGGVNLAAGRPVITPTSQLVQQGLTSLGLPEPENALERAIQTGSSAMAGGSSQAALAAKSGVQALAPLAQNIPQQLAAAGAGGASGQLVGEAVGRETESPIAGVIASLATGVVTGSIAGAAAGKAMNAGQPQAPSLQQIKARAQERYGEMEQSGVAIKPQSVLDMVSNIRNRMVKDSNFNPQMDSHRPVSQVLDQMVDMVGTQRVSFPKLEQMRSAANELRASTDPATRKYAGEVVTMIDGYIGNLGPRDLIAGQGKLDSAVKAVTEARKDWRNLSRAQVLQDAFNVAEARALDPKASESELIRRQLINLSADKRKMAFFNEREKNAIKSVVKGGPADPLLSLLARFNPERNQIVAGGQAAFALGGNPLLSLGTAAGGFAADKYLGATRSKAVEQLIRNTASGNIPNASARMGWRGLLSSPTQPITEQDLELLRGMQ